MNTAPTKNSKKRILIFSGVILLVSALIFIGLFVFSFWTKNTVKDRNLSYLEDNTETMAESLDSALNDGYRNIQVLSKLLGETLDFPQVDIQSVRDIVEDSVFDFMEFADRDGMDHNVTGGVSFARDRQYFLDAREGNTGMELIYKSRATHETLLMFYSPVYYKHQFVGSLVGAYQAANRITKLLTTEYFGEPATSYLFNEEGRIIASNAYFEPGSELYVQNLIDDADTQSIIQDCIEKKEGRSFFYGESKDGACISVLPDNGWFVIQFFPSAVSRAMAQETNSLAYMLVLYILIIYLIVMACIIIFYRRQQKKVEEANMAKTAFLFNMSHDIRTPMNAIIGYTDMAEKYLDDPERTRDALGKLRTSGIHLLNLINDVLDMSRIESGRIEISENPTDIMGYNANIGPMLESTAVAKSISYSTNINNITDRYVYLDRLHVNQILVNVVSNAIKYTPEGGKVCFDVEQIALAENGVAWYSFTVSDTGIGMSPEFKDHIFEAFSREQTSTVSQKQGTGLGLSITKHLVDAMNGTIEVDSTPGAGSTFVIKLPFKVVEDASILSSEEQKMYYVTLENKRILLVEDNAMNREIAADILSEEGAIVEEACDGLEAVRKVRSSEFGYYDLILMDIQMPVMNGYDAAREIREIPVKGRDVPIIALSANAFEEDKKASIDAGMNAHIAKPINVRALLETINSFL